MVYGENYKPFAWGDQGKAMGVQVEFVQEVLANKLGLQVHHEALPWKRAQMLVATGERDGFFTVPTPERETYTQQTTRPFYETHFVMHTSTKNPLIERLKAVQSLPDLAAIPDLKHVHMLGSGWHENALRNMQTVYTIIDAAKIPIMLDTQRADLYIEQKEMFRFQVNELKMGKEILTLDTPSLGRLGWHVFIGKKSKFTHLIPKIDQKLAEMQSSGELEQIRLRLFRKFGME